MPLTISLRNPSTIPLEVDSVRLEIIREQSPDEIKRTPIQRGNRQVPLGEFFDVSGSAADGIVVWEGDCSRVKMIGAKLGAGQILVKGDAGMHLGAEMTGGEIIVEGNAADWAGAEMHGGRIRIYGNAGHLVGAVYRGGHKGMTGGEILVHGNAGNEVGHAMRRGMIAIGGRAGDFAAVGMIAGTVLVCGEAGIRNAAGMKRGTLVFLQPGAQVEPLPTFKRACRYQPTFLRILLKHLAASDFPLPAEAMDATYERWCGDLLELGKGEMLVRA